MMLGRNLVNPSENFKDVVAITSLRTAKKKINAVFICSSFWQGDEFTDLENLLAEQDSVKSTHALPHIQFWEWRLLLIGRV